MLKCVKCGSVVESERHKCPKCDTYTVLSFKARVTGEPKTATNNAGENYVYFSAAHDRGEAYCEIKQGYETEVPVREGDEVELEGRAFLEGNKISFRITKLVNKTASKAITYHAGGCLTNLLLLGGLILVAVLFV